jgi:uncharacterized protein YllA (UPF0747 family)
MFYLNPEAGGARERIRHESGTWTSGESMRWATDALIDAITLHPERFSPNVFLRPILQDYLLPTLAYVAGPGEMAYYAQMKQLYIAQHSGLDPMQLANDWIAELAAVSQKYIDAIGDEDPTLKASADKLITEFETSIDRVKGKLIRSVKQKEQTGINRIRRVKTSLFPDNGLQERTLSGIYFMNKYGTDIWDRVIDAFATVKADEHYVVDL